MGMAGYEHWHMVTPDTAGVPHGGPFGDVDGFAAKAAEAGLLVCWSRMHNCFGLYSKRGQKYVFQLLLLGDIKGPVPFTDELLFVCRHSMERLATSDTGTLTTEFMRMQKDREWLARKAQAKDLYERAKDATTEVLQKMRGRRVIPVAARAGC